MPHNENPIKRRTTTELSLETRIEELIEEREAVTKALRNGDAEQDALNKVNATLVRAFMKLLKLNHEHPIVKRATQSIEKNRKR